MTQRLPSTVGLSVFLLFGVAAVQAAWDPFFAPPAIVADIGAATRPFGIAVGDFDSDGVPDLVVGRTTGHIAFVKGQGDGTFAAPVVFAWKQAYYNAWAFAAADVNVDGKLDVVWGANAGSTGCSVSPAPSPCPTPVTVADGEVRAFLGNGNGTFEQNTYYVSGVLHNAGTLIARIGTIDAGSVVAGDIDGDGDTDIIAGASDASTTAVKLLRNGGAAFSIETITSQPYTTALTSPIYYPAVSTQNSPWGLALGDADADGDLDLFLGDRALYVYLYRNNGAGTFSMQTGNAALDARPNAYLVHESARAAVGYTPSLAAGDLNGDGRADLVLGLQSGGQTSAAVHDGEILLDLSTGAGHAGVGAVGDVGMVARGVAVIDVNGDGALDILAGEYGGKVTVLTQLPPIDDDIDGISDYLDNALNAPNAPRLDMNSDGTVNYLDQLDNDADTVLGNPQDRSTWQRLGDPEDPDDDNDGVPDASDNCQFAANPDQADGDGDSAGNACDPLDGRDGDDDGVPDGPVAGDPLFDLARAAKIKWSSGDTRFVVRIDALGRWFQNEFTQIMTDAATLSPADWAAKCWENYEPGDIAGYQPCGDATTRTLTLDGGRAVPISLVVIPKQLWTDPPVVAWINDRHASPRFELGQHATYHVNNVPVSDWAGLADRNFFSCEMCGLSESEVFEVLKVGFDTLAGNYGNKWVRESGATDLSPKIDWSTSAWPLISFSPPFNASDTIARKATAQLGFKSYSASVFEEQGSYAGVFSPEGSHHEQFDQFGMFHVSADIQLLPPDTPGDGYVPADYEQYLRSQTNDRGLTTWLIEEVDWSGRPCNTADRLGTCNGGSNRENNTVYLPRWNAWLQVLDYVKSYPRGVAMTTGEVALAAAYDNAPTVANADQADSDGNGIGDAIDGAAMAVEAATLSRNLPATLTARLTNGAGAPIPAQHVTFAFDADGNGEDEMVDATTANDGTASVTVTPTRAVGAATFSVAWDGVRLTASGTGQVGVFDATHVVLDPSSPSAGQVTDVVVIGATLTDSDNAPLIGRPLTFGIGSSVAAGVTDATGHASATMVLSGPAGASAVVVSFAGTDPYGPSTATAAFHIQREDVTISLTDAIAAKNTRAIARAVVAEIDGAPLSGKVVTFEAQAKVKGSVVWVALGTGITDASGAVSFEVPARYVDRTRAPLRAVFAGDTDFAGATGVATVVRN